MAADYKLFITDAQKVSQQYGVPASVTLAQIILESSGNFSNGLSSLAANYKNLFGVKGIGTNGSVSLPTKEVVNGKYVTVKQPFRSYKTYYDSIVDHAKLLTSERYTKQTATAQNAEEYAKAIQKAGYATDPNYASKLISIMNKYNLTQYDSGTISSGSTSSGSTSTGSSTSTDSSASSDSEKKGFMSQVFYHVIRIIAILGLFILMVIFFLRAFPAVENAATSVVPVGRALNAAKAAKSATNAVKTAKSASNAIKTVKSATKGK